MATVAQAVMAPISVAPATRPHLAHAAQQWTRLPSATWQGNRSTGPVGRAKTEMQQSIVTRSLLVLQTLLPISLLATAARRQRGSGNVSNRQSVVRCAKMWNHGRDPSGVRHVESRQQARRASTIKTELENIFARCEIQYRRIGDDEIQRRIRIDDVIMSKGCKAAYIHVGAVGDKLQQRQAFVWLVRNKGGVTTAFAKRWNTRFSHMPRFYFVESKFDAWHQQMEKARKYPELNLNSPFAAIDQKLDKMGRLKKRYGVGDESVPINPWGYGHLS